jgi:hypothetical protein
LERPHDGVGGELDEKPGDFGVYLIAQLGLEFIARVLTQIPSGQ